RLSKPNSRLEVQPKLSGSTQRACHLERGLLRNLLFARDDLADGLCRPPHDLRELLLRPTSRIQLSPEDGAGRCDTCWPDVFRHRSSRPTSTMVVDDFYDEQLLIPLLLDLEDEAELALQTQRILSRSFALQPFHVQRFQPP